MTGSLVYPTGFFRRARSLFPHDDELLELLTNNDPELGRFLDSSSQCIAPERVVESIARGAKGAEELLAVAIRMLFVHELYLEWSRIMDEASKGLLVPPRPR